MAGDDFVVELGLKSEGILERGEFDEPDNVKIGDEVRVLLEDVEGDTGLVKISKRKADRIINWEAIMKSKKEGDPVSGKVTKKIKGGLLVDIGVPVFLPASQVDIRRPGEISDWIGRHIDAVILKIDEERRNIVISRRKMIEVAARGAEEEDARDASQVGDARQGHGQEHRRLRRVHRPRRHRRPAAHHRHVLGPDQPPQRDAQDRPGGRGQGPADRQGQGEDRAGPEAEGRLALGEHRDQVPRRLGARGRGGQHHVLRRVLQAGGRRRGPGAHLRDELDEAHQPPERGGDAGPEGARQGPGDQQGQAGDLASA